MASIEKSLSDLKKEHEEHLQLRDEQNRKIKQLTKAYSNTLDDLEELKDILKEKKMSYAGMSEMERNLLNRMNKG